MLFVDIKTWLPDDLLIKADKMSMAASVELRVPLLDHVFVELAASVPPGLKLRRLRGKYILRRTLAGLVPKEVLTRPKAGFVMPYGRWLARSEDAVREALTGQASFGRRYFRRRFLDQRGHVPAPIKVRRSQCGLLAEDHHRASGPLVAPSVRSERHQDKAACRSGSAPTMG